MPRGGKEGSASFALWTQKLWNTTELAWPMTGTCQSLAWMTKGGVLTCASIGRPAGSIQHRSIQQRSPSPGVSASRSDWLVRICARCLAGVSPSSPCGSNWGHPAQGQVLRRGQTWPAQERLPLGILQGCRAEAIACGLHEAACIGPGALDSRHFPPRPSCQFDQAPSLVLPLIFQELVARRGSTHTV